MERRRGERGGWERRGAERKRKERREAELRKMLSLNYYFQNERLILPQL